MKINGCIYKLGADPELFIKCKATGKLVSAHGMLPGDKKNPFKVPHGAVQVDGMAAEFNIDPAETFQVFLRNIKSVMASLQEIIGDEYELVACPTAHFGHELINAQPPEARELGCDPDYDAWSGHQNPTPDVNTPFRTGAGHVHIGWTMGVDIALDEHKQICEHLIRNLDLYTLPFLRLEDDNERRKLYGKAGAYRLKEYGVEYRTPSNVWLKSDKSIRLMWDSVRQAILACVHGYDLIQEKDDFHSLRNSFKAGKEGIHFDEDGMIPQVLKAVTGDENYV